VSFLALAERFHLREPLCRRENVLSGFLHKPFHPLGNFSLDPKRPPPSTIGTTSLPNLPPPHSAFSNFKNGPIALFHQSHGWMQMDYMYFGLEGPLQGPTDEFLGTSRAYIFC
jgi:hypothetical protein